MERFASTGLLAEMAKSLGKIVAENLRRLRLERGLTQEELAHRAGVNRNYVGMIERVENSPTVDMIERIAVELSVNPSELFRDSTNG